MLQCIIIFTFHHKREGRCTELKIQKVITGMSKGYHKPVLSQYNHFSLQLSGKDNNLKFVTGSDRVGTGLIPFVVHNNHFT